MIPFSQVSKALFQVAVIIVAIFQEKVDSSNRIMHKDLIIALANKLFEAHSVVRLLFEPFVKQLICLKLSDFLELLWIGSLFQSFEIVEHLLVVRVVTHIDLTFEPHKALQMP